MRTIARIATIRWWQETANTRGTIIGASEINVEINFYSTITNKFRFQWHFLRITHGLVTGDNNLFVRYSLLDIFTSDESLSVFEFVIFIARYLLHNAGYTIIIIIILIKSTIFDSLYVFLLSKFSRPSSTYTFYLTILLCLSS